MWGTDSLVVEDKVGYDDGKIMLKLTSIYDPTTNCLWTPCTSPVALQGQRALAQVPIFRINKACILAAAPTISVNNENCRLILEKTRIKDLTFHFAADLKMSNICLGISSHAALHPCPYCEGKHMFL